jgi:hypothetical protein
MAKKTASKLSVETLKHGEATRKNIPAAEYQSVMRQDEQSPIRVAYERRNRDLDPYKALKTTLKTEINEEAWASLNSDTSRPFEKPKSGRIAVKVINHLEDEVMKVFRI